LKIVTEIVSLLNREVLELVMTLLNRKQVHVNWIWRQNFD